MRAFIVVVAALALLGAGGWAFAGTLRASSSPTPLEAPMIDSKEPIRLNASVSGDSSRRVRFAGVLTRHTLKWELENANKLRRARFVFTSGHQRLRLCESCRAVELGSVELNPLAVRAAAAGKAVLIVEAIAGRPARYAVPAQRCSCAAGLYFPAPSSAR